MNFCTCLTYTSLSYILFPVLLNPDENGEQVEELPLCTALPSVTVLYVLCLHISLSQSFGGVSQEGYRLQQIGQVVLDFIVSSTVWNVSFWFCASVSRCAEGKHRKCQESWITRCDVRIDSRNSTFVYLYVKLCILWLFFDLRNSLSQMCGTVSRMSRKKTKKVHG